MVFRFAKSAKTTRAELSTAKIRDTVHSWFDTDAKYLADIMTGLLAIMLIAARRFCVTGCSYW